MSYFLLFYHPCIYVKGSPTLQKMAERDCHGTWKYWPATGPVFCLRWRELQGIFRIRIDDYSVLRLLFLMIPFLHQILTSWWGAEILQPFPFYSFSTSLLLTSAMRGRKNEYSAQRVWRPLANRYHSRNHRIYRKKFYMKTKLLMRRRV